MKTKYLSIHRYIKNVYVDRAKDRRFAKYRGTWLPSFDKQNAWGFAINWLGVRINISPPFRYNRETLEYISERLRNEL